MIEFIALAAAVLSLGVSAVLAARVRSLGRQLAAPRSAPPPPLPPAPSPLEGLRVALKVEQDHPHPVFAALLREALTKEDAVEVGPEQAEILIRGKLLCNGYADVYFDADFAILAGADPLFTLVEKPPHGDRQSNLALEIVTRLRSEASRNARQTALRELTGP